MDKSKEERQHIEWRIKVSAKKIVEILEKDGSFKTLDLLHYTDEINHYSTRLRKLLSRIENEYKQREA